MAGQQIEIVVATRNRKKITAIIRMLEGSGIRIMSLDEFPDCPEVEEDSPDFEGNALKKARAAAAFTRRAALADDSGLVVDALGGRPGVYSARYAGEGASDQDNNRKLIAEMEDVPVGKRTARFVCVMAYVSPEWAEHTFKGTVEGRLGFENRGESGFGYDPLFIPDLPEGPEGHDRTFAEMSGEEKDSMSHRGRALAAFISFIKR